MVAKDGDRRHIDSLDALHRLLPELIRLQDDHPRLALAALANPLLAIEHAGYRIAPGLKREMALRTRFAPADAERLLALEAELRENLGKEADLDNPATFAEPLLRAVASAPAKGSARKAAAASPSGARIDTVRLRSALEKPLPPRRQGQLPREDPLSEFASQHPLLARLVAYRSLEQSRPRLADRDQFEGLLAGKTATPVKAARLRYKPAPVRAARKGR